MITVPAATSAQSVTARFEQNDQLTINISMLHAGGTRHEVVTIKLAELEVFVARCRAQRVWSEA